VPGRHRPHRLSRCAVPRPQSSGSQGKGRAPQGTRPLSFRARFFGLVHQAADELRHPQGRRIGLHQPAARTVKVLSLLQGLHACVTSCGTGVAVKCALQPQRHDHSEEQRANQSAAAVSCRTPGMGSSESSGDFNAKTIGPRIFYARNPPEKVAQIRVAYSRYFNNKAPTDVLGRP